MYTYKLKGDFMDVSSSTAQGSAPVGPVDAIKKAVEVQEQAVMKLLEGANEESKQATAQKTGMGGGINLIA